MTNCIRAEVLYTGRSVERNAYLIFEGAKVVGISHSPRGKSVGECAFLTPAFVDAHSHIGIHRHGEPSAESEANDHLDSILVLPDVLDSIQMDDVALSTALEFGTVYSCVMPGSANLLSGLSAVIRHNASDSTSALVARAGMKAAVGYNPMSAKERKGTRPSTRMGEMAVLRGKFRSLVTRIEERRKRSGRRGKQEPLSPEERVLADVLKGKTTLRVHAHKTDDIAAVLRLADEFKLRLTIEHAMDVNRPEIFRELAKRGIPVVYGPVETTASKVELLHKNWRNARLLIESGVKFGLMTDHPVTPSWSILQQTRFLLRCGLTKQQAIETITRVNAEILGIADRVGVLAKDRWASFVCWNGDPFDLASRPIAVYAEGLPVYSE
ncbi:MAG: amidohydrolase family protein [Kiritimatiellae bacterium]|nr:amidohydrolase family protein [Kiritimatiellia bacterium]